MGFFPSAVMPGLGLGSLERRGCAHPMHGQEKGVACRGLKSQARGETPPEPGLFLESTGSLLGQGSIWGSEMIAKMAKGQ